MAEFQLDRRGFKAYRRSRDLQDGELAVARAEVAPKLASLTPRRTGETASSTRVERGEPGAGVYVVQEGASVQVNFGNEHVDAEHYANRL